MVKRAQAGDREAFGQLLKENYDRIYRLAYRWSGLKSDAEEIAQEVCLKLASAIHSFKGEAAFTTWLYRLTLNAARDYHRKQEGARGREVIDPDLNRFASSAPNQEDSLMAGLIAKCIALLPDALRMAVLLVHAEGLNHRQAGEALECAEGTISWRLSEARKDLALCLDKGGYSS